MYSNFYSSSPSQHYFIVLLNWLSSLIEEERGRWFLWVPVFFGIGLGGYFSLLFEPSWYGICALILAGVAALLITYRYVSAYYVLGFALSCLLFWSSLGVLAGKVRTLIVQAPVIEKKTGVVDIYGWVERIEVRKAKTRRITIRVDHIKKISRSQTPYRVRIRVHKAPNNLKLGAYMKFKAVLHALPQPVFPGGFDYGRKLWFERIGGVGFAIAPPELQNVKPATPFWVSMRVALFAFREKVSWHIRNILPEASGHVVAALITGDRSGLSEEVLQALRHSGLAHILAISGLHMAMVSWALYLGVRSLLAFFPSIALQYPIKKISAVIALLGGGYYLLLSGAGISTQRAYIMIAIMFLAVLLERPAISLRNVAMAAFVILIVRPESLLDVGFQMSFAAAVALVAVYERSAQKRRSKIIDTPYQKPLYFSGLWRYLSGIGLTTLIASLAVAPFAVFHFHQLSQFGLLGNLLAMPIVGFIIMPTALVALLLMPFGLEALPLMFMGWGIDILLAVAQFVSDLPGAVQVFEQIPISSVVLMTLGTLWLAIWQKRWRYLGLFGIAFGLALCPFNRLPDVLVERDGKVIAVRKLNGELAVPSARSGRFSIMQWLKIYGDPRPAKLARDKKLFRCDEYGCVAGIKNFTLSYIKHPVALSEDCGKADVIISKIPHRDQCRLSSVTIDLNDLRKNGAHGLYFLGKNIRIETVREKQGFRPWTRE